MVLPETNLILRPGGMVDPGSVNGGFLVSVSGSTSGPHEGQLRLSDDFLTLTFQPTAPFTYGEVVTCRIGSGLVTDTRGLVPPASFTFTIAGPERESLRGFRVPEDGDETPTPPTGGAAARGIDLRSAALAGALPADFPNIQATVYGTPAPGRLFVADLNFNYPNVNPSHLMILENDGTPFFYRRLRGPALDFKKQRDGRLSYFDKAAGGYYALNARYEVVDSFRCGNGYSTDSHDLILLPNGHAVLMSYDTQIIDMRPIALGGQFNARVIGLVLQELDTNKNVVFQWRSWDHFQITDIVSHSLAAPVVDYVHANSVDVDPSGNLILSCRHMNEVTKISRTTGEILWRLGGRNNQFAFINETIPFSHQHDARQLPNGNITLFDNGNFRSPLFSRAVEYAIDETGKTATLVWQYRLNPDVFGFATGSVQRFSNGNTLIGWGATNPTLTEVAPDGTIVSQLTFDPGIASYRALRFEWPPVKPAVITLPTTLSTDPRETMIIARIQAEAASFAVSDVQIMTVRLNATVAADSASAKWSDAKKDSVPDLKVKFPRNAVAPLLSVGINRVEVSGSLKTGEIFRGFAEMTVLAPTKVKQLAVRLRLVSSPGAIPVELTAGAEGAQAAARTFAVFDVQGRLVARWRTMVGGGRNATWDGLGSNGRRVASGIYLIRAEDGTVGSALKVVIAR